MSSARKLPALASFCLATSDGSNLSISPYSQREDLGTRSVITYAPLGKQTHMPCSSSFLTFHMVISAEGELEMMMIGLLDLAFFAPLGCSVRSACTIEEGYHDKNIPYAGCEDVCAVLLAGPDSAFRSALIFSLITFCTNGAKF